MLKGSTDMKLKTKKKVKKKDKPKKFVGKGLKIVDEDVFSLGYKPPSDSDDEDVEDLPQIAAVVDERPVEVQVLETFSQSKWKRVQDEDEAQDSRKNFADRDSDDPSPPRRGRDSEDLSPPRRRRDSGDISPPRRRRVSEDGSPPRQRRRRDSEDLSPPRRRRNSRDMSPPRRRRNSGDVSPQRQRQSRDSEDLSRRRADQRDLSPSRQRRRRDSGDFSPPRRRRNSDDLSPPRQARRRDSRDVSPSRRRKLSPTRYSDGKRRERNRNPARPEILETSDDDGKSKTTLDGKKAGLQKAAALRDEMLDFRKRENQLFETLPDEVSGRHAKAVKRDRRTEADIAKEQEKQRKEEERKQQYSKWGKGLKQVEEQEARVRSALHEMAKPLARYEDDEDLDDHLKSIDREGDPMLEYLQAKRRKASGVAEKPKYSGPPPPPNRFHIPPGYRWDGVDRSNGYEKEWFNRINAKKAVQEEAYKWSVEDL